MNLKYCTFFIILTLSCNIIFSQHKPASKDEAKIKKFSSHHCIAKWKNKDSITYVIVHKKGSLEDETNILTYWAQIKVIDSTENGFMLIWKYLAPPDNLHNANADKIYDFYKGLSIVFKTDISGELLEVVNWEEVKDYYIHKLLESDQKIREADTVVLNKVKEMFSSKEMVENVLAKEVMLLLRPYGATFYSYETKQATSLPNPFIPDKPIPAFISYKLSENNFKDHSYSVSINQYIDKKDAIKLFESVFDKLKIPNDSALNEAKKLLANFEMNDSSVYKFQLPSNWVTSANYKRTVKSDNKIQEDYYFISMFKK